MDANDLRLINKERFPCVFIRHLMCQRWKYTNVDTTPILMAYRNNARNHVVPMVGGITGEFPAQRPVTRSYDVIFDLRRV